MKKFIIKLFLFLFPFLILFGFPFCVLFMAGDLTPEEKVIETQQKVNSGLVLFGPAFSNLSPYFKLKSALAREPDVMCLGTSRVMQFRSEFFRGSVTFYNAGGAVSKIKHFKHFLEKIPRGKEPKLLIIGLDQYFFNPHWDKLINDDIEKQLSANYYPPIDILLDNWKPVYFDYYKKKYSLSKLFINRKKNLIGLNALVNGNGTRNDGSYRDVKPIKDPLNPKSKEYHFKNTFNAIVNGDRRFEYSEKISLGAVDALDLFLKICKEREIYVIGFLPSYPHVVYEKLTSMNKYEYLFQIPLHLKPIFSKYDFGFYDFSDFTWIGASDSEAIDGLHGSEKTYLRLFIKMAESNYVLKQYSQEVVYLKMMLNNSKGDYDVFRDAL